MKRWLWLVVLTGMFASLAGIQHMSAAQSAPGAGQRGPNERYYAIQSKLDQGGSFYLYSDLKGGLKSFLGELQPILTGPGMPPEAAKAYAIANQVIDRLGLYGIHDLGISSVPDGDYCRNKVFISTPEGRQQGLAAILGGAPHPFSILDRAPAGALTICDADFDSVAAMALVRQIITDIAGPEGQAKLDEGLGEIKKDSGLDVEAINQSLAGQFAFVLDQDPTAKLALPVPGLQPIDSPRLALMIKVKDATLYESLKQLIAKKAPGQAEATDGKFKYVMLPVPMNPFWPVSPAVGTDGEFVFITTHLELSRILAAPKGALLRDSEEFKKLAAGLPTEGNGLVFASPRLGAIVQQVLQNVQSAAGQSGEMPAATSMQLKLMQDNFKKSFDGAITVRVNQPDGIFMVNRSKAGAAQFAPALLAAPTVGILAAIAVPNFLEAQGRSKVARAKGDMRTMGIAIETYYIDQNSYPAYTAEPGRNASGPFGEPDQPSFMMPRDANDKLMTLTTPIAYITTYFNDPFAPKKGGKFSYWASPQGADKSQGYIIWSAGPDGKYDINLSNVSVLYDPKGTVPSQGLVFLTYDPSNGTVSPGDIWRVKQ